MYKEDLALNKLQRLIGSRNKPKQIIYMKIMCMKRIWH